jgi:class 3 adenylate cyclase
MLQNLSLRDFRALRNLFSHSPALRVIGSDPASSFKGEEVLPFLQVLIGELPDFDMSVAKVEAFEMGPVAWGNSISDLRFPDGRVLELRHTAVFVLEEGVWRCVQNHASVPQEYERSFGVALTVTLSDLLDSLDFDAVSSGIRSEGLGVLMFTDIENSTVLAQQMGDARWMAVIADHDGLIRGEVEASGGTVIKTLGDGALARFDSARGALRCAIRLQAGFANRPFEVRMGIHAGELYDTSDDVIGATVNKAARVAAAAAGGQIVISSIVKELVGGTDEFSYGESFTAELKGIDGLHELTLLDLSPSLA